jgi:hypothetical protein
VEESERLSETSGNKRVVGGWWWEWDDGDGGVYRGRQPAGVPLTIGQLSAGLSGDDERMLVAVHEVGHVAAIHGLGLGFGSVQIPQAPKALDAAGTVTQLGLTEFPEQDITGHQSAMVSLGGWVATEVWLREERKFSLERSLFVQTYAAHDHHVLLHRRITAPAAFHYGVPPSRPGWTGQTVDVDAVCRGLKATIRSRWSDLNDLAEIVARERSASPERVSQTLGTPGWMN